MAATSTSRLDRFYRRMLITRFFEKGWGKPDNLRRLFEFRKFVSNRDTCYNLIPRDYPVQITNEEKTSECRIIEGRFLTPMELYLPGLVPKESLDAHFQLILPLKWKNEKYKPICVHLAGTGDHVCVHTTANGYRTYVPFFWRRRHFLAKPLLREGNIGALLLENPFYGLRKPMDQVRSNLQNVSDIFVMGGCLILENLVLFHFCERNGLGPLGISGLSMGGHMASLAATNWPKPLVLVPCLSWSTAAAVFTEGVMSESINWDMLETQYFADGNYRDRLAKMVTIVDESFLAGKNFAQNFKQSISNLDHDVKEIAEHRKDSVSAISECNAIRNDSDKIMEIYKQIEQLNCESMQQRAPPTNSRGGDVIAEATLATKKKTEPIDTTKVNWWEREALQFMRGVMDECTHLKNFTVPYDTSLITAVCAKEDAYVPRDGCSSLEDVWPGAQVKYLDAGHVTAYVLHQKLIRSSIIEGFEKAKLSYDKYREPKYPKITMDTLRNRRHDFLARFQESTSLLTAEEASEDDRPVGNNKMATGAS